MFYLIGLKWAKRLTWATKIFHVQLYHTTLTSSEYMYDWEQWKQSGFLTVVAIFYHELNSLFTRVTNLDGDDGGEDIKRSYFGVKRTIQSRRLIIRGKHCGDHRTGFDLSCEN